MPYIKIWVHIVWTTKDYNPLLVEPAREKIFLHIAQNAKSKGIRLNVINGYIEHIHCLISLDDFNISKVLQLLKGESAYWINKQNLCRGRFEWQDEYFAVSVCESNVQRVRDYILNQKEHHRRKSFKEEYDEFISRYFSYLKG